MIKGDRISGIAILFLATVLVCAALCGAFLLASPSGDADRLMSRIINSAGIFITSLSLLLGGYFAILAVSAYGHVAKIQDISDDAAKASKNTGKALEQAQAAAKRCGQIEAEICEEAIECWNRHYAAIERSMHTTKLMLGSLCSDVLPQDKRDELTGQIERARTEALRARALAVFRLSDDPSTVATQIHYIISLKDKRDVEALKELRKKWGDDEEIVRLINFALTQLGLEGTDPTLGTDNT